MKKQNASLTIVGTGIKFLSHLTLEAKIHIEQSEIVLFLVNNPIMKEWIHKTNSNAKSLDTLYFKYPKRLDAYQAITDYIVDQVYQDQHVCVVLYGHPTIFSEPALTAALRLEKEGYTTKILPGISAEDCLFADLRIDPARGGCQSFDATDFLIHRRNFSPYSHLILWQPNIIGAVGHPSAHNNHKGINLLCDYLKSQYDLNHEIILYEAAQFSEFKANIISLSLKNLPITTLSKVCTLYLPPVGQTNIDHNALKILGFCDAS